MVDGLKPRPFSVSRNWDVGFGKALSSAWQLNDYSMRPLARHPARLCDALKLVTNVPLKDHRRFGQLPSRTVTSAAVDKL